MLLLTLWEEIVVVFVEADILWHLCGLVQASEIAPASSQSHLKFQLIHAWFALVRLAIAIYGVNLGGKCKM